METMNGSTLFFLIRQRQEAFGLVYITAPYWGQKEKKKKGKHL